MTNYRLRIEGLDQLRSLMKRTQFNAVLDRALSAMADHLEGEAKERTPVRAGHLKASITHRRIGPLRWSVGTDKNYAPHVEFGTKAHEIKPRFKKALAWPISGQTAAGLGHGPQGTRIRGGALIVRKRVWHPGTKGQHMFRRAVEENLGSLQNILRVQVERALRG